MSIATVSPNKYHFQDLVCLELMLRFEFVGDASFTVESGVEDGDLRVGSGKDASHYEIQVKGADGPVAIGQLGKWLLHTPRNVSGQTALERLMADPTRYFVLIASGRCTDDVAALRFAEDWRGQAHTHVSLATANAVMAAFGAAEPEGTEGLPLHAARIAHRDAVHPRLKVMAVARALRRMVILEEVDQSKVERWIDAHLVARGMPFDRVEEARSSLISVIRHARGDGKDALFRLDDKLRKLLPKTIAPPRYIGRGSEDELTDELKGENRLLLSGVGRSGKSVTARHLGAQFERQGFSVGWFTTVEAAAAFLEDPAAGPRLAVIDDPLGDSRHPPEATLAKLNRLIATVRDDRRLIVAQGQEPLLEAAHAKRLAEIRSGGASWHDFSRPSPSFLEAFWKDASTLHGFPKRLIDPVATLLSANAAPGVGALDFLSRSGDQLSEDDGADDALRLAARDARLTGSLLRSRMASQSTATALILSSTDVERVSATELGFVQGKGGQMLPSYADFTGHSSTLGVNAVPAKPFPDYDVPPATDAATRADLGLFDRLHVVDVDRSSDIKLSHGFYREALSSTVPTSSFESNELLTMHRRALFSRSAATTRAAARNLDVLMDLIGATDEARRLVFEQAIDGLHSYFLATRDICFAFLLRYAGEAVRLVEHTSVNAWVQTVTFISLDQVQWFGDDAIQPIDGEVAFLPVPSKAPLSAVRSTLDALAGNGALPSPREAAAALGWLKRRPGLLSAFQAERLLSYQEGIIRAEAVRVWLSRPREADAALLARIGRDEHPLVAIGALRGLRDGLRDCGVGRRTVLRQLMSIIVSRPTGALAVMDDLVLFERTRCGLPGRRRDTQADWILFAQTMPTALLSLPAETSFDTAKFANVLDEAKALIPTTLMVRICIEWLAWLVRMAASGRTPGDFESTVVPILIEATHAAPQSRGDLISKALQTPQTHLLLRFIGDAVDKWGDLTVGERNALIEALRQDSADAHWRRAAALTRRTVPQEVQQAVLPAGTSLSSAVQDLRTNMPEPLLRACLSLHCGHPTEVGGIAHSQGVPPWQEIVGIVALEAGSPMIEIILPYLCRHVDAEQLGAAVAEGVGRVSDSIFSTLVAESGYPGREVPAPGWKALFAGVPDTETRERWYDELAAASPWLFDDFADIDALLTDRQDAHAVEIRLVTDIALARLVVEYKEGPDFNAGWGQLSSRFEATLDAGKPRLFRFFDGCVALLRNHGTPSAGLAKKIEARRAEIFEDKMEIYGRYHPHIQVQGWVR